MKLDEALGKPSVVRAFLRVSKQSEEDNHQRAKIWRTFHSLRCPVRELDPGWDPFANEMGGVQRSYHEAADAGRFW
jgi:hypothetical protein